jgi:DNA-directed RNA polymerase subunit RPC12/RpoP
MHSEIVFVHEPKGIGPIRCDKCGSRAHFIRRTPDAFERDGSETWTFECECGEQVQQTQAMSAELISVNAATKSPS